MGDLRFTPGEVPSKVSPNFPCPSPFMGFGGPRKKVGWADEKWTRGAIQDSTSAQQK